MKRDLLQNSLLRFESNTEQTQNLSKSRIKGILSFNSPKAPTEKKVTTDAETKTINPPEDVHGVNLSKPDTKNENIPSEMFSPAKICVVGVGGAGNNVINEMANYQKEGNSVVKIYALNTDLQHFATLKNLSRQQLVLINSPRTKGKGSGGDPAIGESATKDFERGIQQLLQGIDLCIIIAGLGKGTGTGGGPIVAQIARKMNCATVAILITPSHDDGNEQFKKTRNALQNFMSVCDGISLISNDTVINKDNTSVFEARSMINRTICTTVNSIVNAIVIPSEQNIDLSDVKSFIKREDNVNQLLHLQVDLFDNDLNKIKAKLQNSLEHNLYNPVVEKMTKLLIQFNISDNCDVNVVHNVISEIKALTKNEDLSITTGIRYVKRNDQKNIDIFLAKPNLATINNDFRFDNQWSNSDFSRSVTLSSESENFIRTNKHFAESNKLNLKPEQELNEDVIDFDTDKMSSVLNTMLVKNPKKAQTFDDELLKFKETKSKN